MGLLLNLLFGVVGYLLAEIVLTKVGIEQRLATVLAIIVGILVFFANLASQI